MTFHIYRSFQQAIFAVVPQNKSRLDCQWIDSQSCSHLRRAVAMSAASTKGKHFRGQEMMMCAKHQGGHCLYRLYLEVLSSKLPKNV